MKACLSYRLLKKLADRIYPRYTMTGTENIPEGPCILVSNHAQIHGPAVSQLRLPKGGYTWCNEEMMHLKEVPAYARKDFWSGKPGWSKPFYHLLSWLIAPLAVFVFGNADVIPVYRDVRVMETLKKTVEALKEGACIVIFPEKHEPHNAIVAEFQQGFVDVARIYSRKAGSELPFVPMYIAPALRTISFGKPVYSCRQAGREEEQKRISEAMMKEITDLARKLPPHRVVPYENIERKKYPMSR